MEFDTEDQVLFIDNYMKHIKKNWSCFTSTPLLLHKLVDHLFGRILQWFAGDENTVVGKEDTEKIVAGDEDTVGDAE